MPKWIVAFVLLFAFASAALADYVSDRKAAVALVKAGQHDEALSAFTKMAEDPASDVQKSDALAQAAQCAIALKQYDRAMELARQIPDAPRSQTCQMLVLESERKWPEIVETFAAADIDTWPESVRGDAFFRRGYAYRALKNGPAAAQDLGLAVEYLTDHNAKGLCLNYLGDTYATLLKDDERAIDTYRLTYRTGNVYKQCQAAISVANILRQQRRFDAAIDELGKIEMDQVTAPYWRGAMLRGFGQALTVAGQKAAAIAKYEEALRLEGLPDEVRNDCENALKQLHAE